MTLKSESDLCDKFIKLAKRHGWKVYPENKGWDIFIEKDNIQVGVQAKKTLNVQVLAQAHELNNVNFKFVLVYKKPGKGEWRRQGNLISDLGLVLIGEKDLASQGIVGFFEKPQDSVSAYSYFYCPQKKKEWVPDFEPKLKAGVKSPIQLTEWKQKAIQFIAFVKTQKFVISRDFRRFGMHPKTWLAAGWMERKGKHGRSWKYSLSPATKKNSNRPDHQHPDILEKYMS